MKRFLFFLGALLLMQTYATLSDSANDTIWTRKSHSIIGFEFSPTNNYFLSLGSEIRPNGSRKGVIIFNTEGDTIKVLNESEGLEFIMGQGIWDAHFSRDGSFLVVIWEHYKDNMSDGMIEIFETENWTSVKRMEVPGNSFSLLGAQVLISPDNNTVVAKTMDGLYFYDVQNGGLLKHISDYGQDKTKNIRIMFLFYSSDGQYIYFNATDNKLRFLNTQTYQIDYSRQDQSDNLQYGSIAVSKSGNLLVNDAGHEELRIINTQTREIIHSIPVFSTGSISGMDFSPDERYLAVNFGTLKVIKVYDIQTGQYIYEYTTVPSGYALTGIGISPDQKYIVTSSGKIFLYKFLPTTGVEEIPEQKDVIIYPNPTTNLVTLNIDEKYFNGEWQITDMSGRVILSGIILPNPQLQINIEHLTAQTYYLRLQKENFTVTYQVVKL